jgi:hypothetical protein
MPESMPEIAPTERRHATATQLRWKRPRAKIFRDITDAVARARVVEIPSHRGDLHRPIMFRVDVTVDEGNHGLHAELHEARSRGETVDLHLTIRETGKSLIVPAYVLHWSRLDDTTTTFIVSGTDAVSKMLDVMPAT